MSNLPQYTVTAAQPTDMRTETVALLAASLAFNRWFNPEWSGPASHHAARRALEDVAWAERIGRLPQLHASLTGGAS